MSDEVWKYLWSVDHRCFRVMIVVNWTKREVSVVKDKWDGINIGDLKEVRDED